MIVLDASIVVELLLNRPGAEDVRRELAGGEPFLAPHLLDVEVASAFRKMTSGQADSYRTKMLLADLISLPVARYAHTPLLERIWELRHNFTAYDAAYIALAELTGSVLYTMDAKLRSGHRARVKLLGS